MGILIIYGHPNKEGHNGEILRNVKRKLKSESINYEIYDLYHMNFNPVLKEHELYTQGKRKVDEDVKKFQESFKKAKHIILIYPVWWNGMPGMVKGFFDKVLTPGFAYRFKKIIFNQGYPQPLLKGKKATVFMTTASHKLLYTLITKKRAHKQIKIDLLGICGIKTKVVHIDNCLTLKYNKERISRIVNKKMVI